MRRERLLDEVEALPAAGPLLRALADRPGGLAADPPVYLVGGAVRDLLLGRAPRELDLCADADAAQLAIRLGGRARTHERFGTCTVELDGARYDIARTRSEAYARPGALPTVAPAGLDTDLKRRDFTVNALALALSGGARGELYAVPSAAGDLAARILRVLHDGSFRDDPTRLLRLVRYAARLGFAPEHHTARLAADAVADRALETVSATRIGNELRLLAREPDPVRALLGLTDLGLNAAIGPGFGLGARATAERALALLPADGRRDLLALAVAWRGVAAPARDRRLTDLGFTAGEHAMIAVGEAAEALSLRLRAAAAAGAHPSAIADAVGAAGAEAVALAGALGAAEPAREWLERLRHVRLEITGDDLRAAGLAPGPAIGRGLRAALAAKLDGHTAGRQAELAEALRGARVREP